MYELDAIKEAAFYIENHISDDLNVNHLAKKVGVNQNKLEHGFKMLYGITVHSFINDYGLRLVKTLLSNTDIQIGITSKSYFSNIFKERYGLSPKEFKLKQPQ